MDSVFCDGWMCIRFCVRSRGTRRAVTTTRIASCNYCEDPPQFRRTLEYNTRIRSFPRDRPQRRVAIFCACFSNRSKLGWRAIWARYFFWGKTSPSGTKRVRTTTRCMTLVHLCLFLSIACGHLPGIFGPVTKAIPRAKDTQRETVAQVCCSYFVAVAIL